jgi:Reverse transcriptase (RNA-dependent DNA polymerase)
LADDAEEGDIFEPTYAEHQQDEIYNVYLQKLFTTNNIKKSTARGLAKLRRRGTVLSNMVVVLDTGAERSMFRDKDLVSKVWDTKEPIMINGISENGSLLITQKAISHFGEGYFDERLQANILSFGEAVDNFDHVTFHRDMDMFQIRVSPYGQTYRFARDDYTNLYICDLMQDGPVFIEDPVVLAVTVDDRMSKYTRREIKRAEAARELQRKFYFLSDQTLEDLLRLGKIKKTSVTALDVRRAADIWGPATGILKGKSTSKKSPAMEPGEKLRSLQPTQQVLHTDIMFVNRIPYLISVLEPVEAVQITRLKARDQWTIWNALERHIKFPERFGLRTSLVRVDGESAMATNWFRARCSIIDSGGAGVAVPIVERKIRTIKERVRAVLNTLPFQLTEKLEEWCVRGAVYSINLIPTRNTVEYASPREKLFGTIVDAEKDLRHAFGDYVQVHEEEIDNTMKSRTRAALALMPTGAQDGSWYYWSLETGHILKRRRATSLPMPQSVIDAVRRAAKTRKGGEAVDITVQFEGWKNLEGADPVPENQENFDPAVPIEFAHPQDNFPDMESVGDDIEDELGLEDQLDEDDQPDNEQLIKDIFGEDDDDDVDIQGEHQPPINQGEHQPPINQGDLEQPRRSSRLAEHINESIHGLKLSIDAAIKLYGYDAILSVVKEIKQMVDSTVFDGVDEALLTKEEWQSVISSMLFLKEKYSPMGEFQKLKSRLVAGGHQQDPTLFEKGVNSAPTIATQSVLMIAAIAAAEGRAVAAVDIPGAFLKSDMPDDGNPVLMKLNKFLTTVLVKVDPNYNKFVRHDGTCIVRLKKALYGTVQAAKAWYDKLSADLGQLGFKPNPADPCCFNMCDSKGSQITIIVHVDDLFITAANEAELDIVIASIDQLYSDGVQRITIQRGKNIEYLGMVFNFTANNLVKITMDGYVADLLSDVEDITGTAETPASKELFRVRDAADKLADTQGERFHSIMAKILYLAKRVRPDLLVAVAFLVRRVQCPDCDDWDKMQRLVRYIRGTQHFGICLDAGKHISITAYVDASFGVHFDMKSHTGSIITLGRGPVFARSTVQRLNTISSAEAELVGLSDSTGQIIWTRHFLEGQNYNIGAAKVFEDNQSAIRLAENGRSNSSRTRHIAIRYFFISDRIKSGEIMVEYLDTTHMIADILTKPLQGALFKKLRAQLMNLV